MDYLRIDRHGNLRQATHAELNKDKKYVAPHHEWTPYTGPVVWTGPDGDRHHRLKTYHNWQCVGIGNVPREKTLSSTYISQSPRHIPFPKSRVNEIGEIGWWYNNYHRPVIRRNPIFMER